MGNPFDRAARAWTVAVLLFLHLPVAVLVAWSFNASRLAITWGGFSTRWYGEALRDAGLVRALANSLWVAAWTTALAVLLGTAAAVLLERWRFRGERTLEAMLLLPMIAPEVVIGASLLALFAATGLELGFVTVVVSHVTFCIPFVALAVRSRLVSLDPAIEEAALDLGATPARAARRVVLPLLAPAILSGALMAFALSLDEFVVTWFTAGAASRTLPLEIYGRVRKGLDPSLNAVSTVLVVASILLVFATGVLRKRVERARAEGRKAP